MGESTQVSDLNKTIETLNNSHTEYANYIKASKQKITNAINMYPNTNATENNTLEELSNMIESITSIPRSTYYYESGTEGDTSTIIRYKKINGNYYLCNENGTVAEGAVPTDVSSKQLIEYTVSNAGNISAGRASFINNSLLLGDGTDVTGNINQNVLMDSLVTFDFNSLDYTLDGITIPSGVVYSPYTDNGYCVIGDFCFVRVNCAPSGDYTNWSIFEGLPKSAEDVIYFPSNGNGYYRGQSSGSSYIQNTDDGKAKLVSQQANTYATYASYCIFYKIAKQHTYDSNAYIKLETLEPVAGVKVTATLYVDDVAVMTLGSADKFEGNCYIRTSDAIDLSGKTSKIYAKLIVHDKGNGYKVRASLYINNKHKETIGFTGGGNTTTNATWTTSTYTN